MKKTYRYILAWSALLAFAGGCDTGEYFSGDSGRAVLSFSVSESMPDLATKSGMSGQAGDDELRAGETLVLTSSDGRTISLLVTQEAVPAASEADLAAATKAARIYRSGETALGGGPFAVWAYNMASEAVTTPASWELDGGTGSTPVKAVQDGDKWKPETDIYYNMSNRSADWKTRWFALAPWDAYNGSGAAVSGLSVAANQAPTLTYAVPGTAEVQWDLLSAASAPREVSAMDAVALKFCHVLTAVRFKKESSLNVTSVKLSGVYDRGVLDLTKIPADGDLSTAATDDDPDFLWTNRGTQTAVYTLTPAASDWKAEGGAQLIDTAGTGNKLLMLLPQWLPDGAEIAVTVDGTEYKSSIAGHKWPAGRMVTYRIGSASVGVTYHLEVEVLSELTAGASAEAVKVRSYSTPVGGGAKTAAPWLVRGPYSTKALAEAGGMSNRPLWTAAPVTAAGSTDDTGERVRMTAPAATAENKTVTEILKEAAPRGSAAAYWNLANPADGTDRIVESANSYVINAPGYYRIPLVAGNGVKNDAPNPSAYPANFMDYTGAAPIASPYLHKTTTGAGTPTTAAVVWAETDMVENLSVTSTGTGEGRVYWLNFRIPQEKIEQGCTVVSVKDGGGTVMWSWLLWATDYEPGAGDVAVTYTTGGATATLMQRNLGWSVDGTLTHYPAEEVWLRIESEDGPSLDTVVCVRRATTDPGALPRSGHGPLFQWGRKDAMPPVGVTLASGSFSSVAGTSGMKASYLIQNPQEHVRATGSNWYPFQQSTEANWWSAGATSAGQKIATVKTIYDPCPAGYAVPRLDAFDGFVAGASTWDNASSPAGYSFNTGYRTAGSGTVYFPAAGRRDANTTTSTEAGTGYGHYWTAVPQGTGTSRRLYFTSGSVVLPTSGSSPFFNKAGEHSVRPVRIE